jgi:hypothetical protein
MEPVVRAAVVEVAPQPRSDREPVVLVDGDVPAVEEAVNVRSENKSVGYRMLASICVRLDVSSLEGG